MYICYKFEIYTQICIRTILFYTSVDVNNKYYHIDMLININMNKLDYVYFMHNLNHNIK